MASVIKRKGGGYAVQFPANGKRPMIYLDDANLRDARAPTGAAAKGGFHADK